MNKIIIMIISLIAGILISGPGICEVKNITDGQSRLQSLLDKLREREIRSVEILWMDPTAESRATITPEILDKIYFRKLMIRKLSGDPAEQGLIESVRISRLRKADSKAEGDVRWAIKFYARENAAPVVSIYLDGSGETGSIDGTPYSFNVSLHAWLKTNFSPVSASRGNK